MQAVDKITYTNDWITILFFILFASIVLLKLINASKVKENFLSFLSFTLIEDDDIETTSFFNVFQVILLIFSVTVLSLLLYQFKLVKAPESELGILPFLSILGGLFLYLIFKRCIEYLLLLLFKIKRRMQFFLVLKNNYLYSVCFLLYVSLVLTEYCNLNLNYLLLFATFLFILRFVFLVVRNKKLIFNKLFYFILYLCALEIAPLFVLFKLMF